MTSAMYGNRLSIMRTCFNVEAARLDPPLWGGVSQQQKSSSKNSTGRQKKKLGEVRPEDLVKQHHALFLEVLAFFMPITCFAHSDFTPCPSITPTPNAFNTSRQRWKHSCRPPNLWNPATLFPPLGPPFVSIGPLISVQRRIQGDGELPRPFAWLEFDAHAGDMLFETQHAREERLPSFLWPPNTVLYRTGGGRGRLDRWLSPPRTKL